MFGDRRNLRYFAGFAAVIVLLIFVIVLIVHHGGSSTKVQKTQRTLTSYASDSSAYITETIIGPINATQEHDQVQINVSNQSTNVQISKGYDNNVTNTKNYPMTQSSFGEFLSALNRAGYTEGTTSPNLQDDRGYCPTGERYIFELHDGSTAVERFWATSCGGAKTYKGNVNLTLSLFQAQVPDYNTLVDNADFDGNIFNI